jgi:hypothetical protein
MFSTWRDLQAQDALAFPDMNVMHLEGFQHGFLGEGLPWGAKRTSRQGEGALFRKGSFAKWKGHLDVEKQNSSREAFSRSKKDIEKWNSPREAPSQSGRDNPTGIRGIPRGGSLLGSERNFLMGRRGAPWGGALLGVERTSWWGRRVSLGRGRNFPAETRGTPQGGALSRTKGSS